MKKTCLLFAAVIGVFNTFAFRPVAHIVLQKTISKNLPSGNLFKEAMDSNPTFAAWGAVGPDMAYIPLKPTLPKIGYKRKWAKSSMYADIAHYYKTGTFSKALLSKAVEKKDKRLIAFAAGWLTHVAGDFGSHGIFVYPEAGYYLDNPEGQELHGELEKYAESVIFTERGKDLGIASYGKAELDVKAIYREFLGSLSGAEADLVHQFLKEVFEEVYKDQQYKLNTTHLMKRYYQAFGEGLGHIAGFGMEPYNEAIKRIDDNKTNLDAAFDYASTWAQDKLGTCVSNKYKEFSDEWNLDVGAHTKTLIVKARVHSKKYSGSKNPLFVTMKLKTAHTYPLNYKIKLFGNVRYNRGDMLYSYIYLNDHDYDANKLYSFTIQKSGTIKDKTELDEIVVEDNTGVLFQSNKPLKLNSAQPISEKFRLTKPLSKDAKGQSVTIVP